MNEEYIIGLIKDLIKRSNFNKDDGTDIVNSLANIFRKINELEKNSLIKFFLKEIEFNINGFWSICMDTFVEANCISVAPELNRIFVEQKAEKDDFWKYRFTRALLKLKCKSLSYMDFIDDLINKEDGSGYILLILLSSVNPDMALVKLSEYYTKYLTNTKIEKFIKRLLGLLFENISINGSKYVISLVEETNNKNRKSGLFLKRIFIDFLKSEETYNKYFKEQVINKLLLIK